MNLHDALEHLKAHRLFKQMERRAETGGDYSIDTALEVVQEIGRQRTPRFTVDADNRFAFVNFIKWLHGDVTMQALDPTTGETVQGNLYSGIYIAGGTGTGKTWCTEIMLEYAKLFKFPIKYGEKDGKLIWADFRADDIAAHYLEEVSVSYYKDLSALCIQDLGSEQGEAVAMGNRLNVLRSLLEWRGDRADKITLITSNYSMKNPMMAKQYGERVMSRLCEMCNYFEIKGRDRRKARIG